MVTVSRHTLGVVAALSLAVVACAREPLTKGAADPATLETAEAGDPAGGESIFGLDLALVDQDDDHLTLAELQGHVMLAAMVYTNCTSVCIMVTEQMKAIEQQLAGVDDNVKYVLFSLDPGRDRPAALRQFAREHHLEAGRWRLLASSEEGVRDLAAVLGVRYQAEQDGEIAHSAMIFVIDARGVVRHRQVGVDKSPVALVAAVKRARG